MRARLAWRCSAGFTVLAAAIAPLSSVAQNVIPQLNPGERVQQIELIAGLNYDSNVAGSSGQLAAQRGLTQSDVVFEPSVQFELARPIGRETVYLNGSAGYDFYRRNSILNRERLDVRPGVLGRFGSCVGGVGGEYSRAQSNLSELALSPFGLPVTLQQQNILQVEEVAANASCGRATGLAPNVSVSESWTQNSSAVQRFTNARTLSASAGLAYRRPVLGSISLFGSFSHTDYPDRAGLIALQGAAISTSFQTLSAGLTYSRAIGSRLQGSVSLSYTKLDSSGGAKGFSGPTYSAGLSYQASSRLRFQGAVSRATAPSNRLNSNYGLQELYSAQGSYQLGPRIVVTAGASYGHNSYDGVPFPKGFDLTDEKNYTLFGDAELRLTRRLSLGANIQHISRNANYPGLSFPDTRAGLTARATF